MMKLIFAMQINIKVFYKMILSFWVYIARHAQSTQNKKFAYLFNISRKTWRMKLIFCLQINAKVFCKLIISLWVCVARHAQSTQKNKFAISLQYPKENKKNEVDFLPADKYQRFSEIDTVILCVCGQACTNYLKELVMKLIFLHADKHETFLQIDTKIFNGDGQAFLKLPK